LGQILAALIAIDPGANPIRDPTGDPPNEEMPSDLWGLRAAERRALLLTSTRSGGYSTTVIAT
jgi:hypothetical protein